MVDREEIRAVLDSYKGEHSINWLYRKIERELSNTPLAIPSRNTFYAWYSMLRHPKPLSLGAMYYVAPAGSITRTLAYELAEVCGYKLEP